MGEAWGRGRPAPRLVPVREAKRARRPIRSTPKCGASNGTGLSGNPVAPPVPDQVRFPWASGPGAWHGANLPRAVVVLRSRERFPSGAVCPQEVAEERPWARRRHRFRGTPWEPPRRTREGPLLSGPSRAPWRWHTTTRHAGGTGWRRGPSPPGSGLFPFLGFRARTGAPRWNGCRGRGRGLPPL